MRHGVIDPGESHGGPLSSAAFFPGASLRAQAARSGRTLEHREEEGDQENQEGLWTADLVSLALTRASLGQPRGPSLKKGDY